MDFYHLNVTTYHNSTCIGQETGNVLLDDKPTPETIDVTWDNLNEIYQKFPLFCAFNIFNFKRGRLVSFFSDHLFLRRDEWDVKEWKHPDLNIRLKITYTKYSPSISKVLNWHDGEKALAYLRERGWGK